MGLVSGSISAYQGPQADRWPLIVTRELVYQGAREIFRVPKEFPTDGASVPGWLKWIVPAIGKHTFASALHDWQTQRRRKVILVDQLPYERPVFGDLMVAPGALPHAKRYNGFGWVDTDIPTCDAYTYEFPEDRNRVTRKDADGIFRRNMREAGVAWHRRWLMYWAVRAYAIVVVYMIRGQRDA